LRQAGWARQSGVIGFSIEVNRIWARSSRGRGAASQFTQRRKAQTQNIVVDAFFDPNLRAGGKANLHRPEPRRARRVVPQTGAPSSSAVVSVGTPCSATRRIGTTSGVSLASRDELVAADAPSPAPQRRSGQPFHERRIHLKTRFASTPFARATPAIDARGVRAALSKRRPSPHAYR